MEFTHAKFRVMLVADDTEHQQILEQALTAASHVIAARLGTKADLLTAINLHKPDIILIDVDAPHSEMLESLDHINRDQPLPVIIFTGHSDAETTRRVMDAGVSAFVMDGLRPERIPSLLHVAVARFEAQQVLHHDLNAARSRLSDLQDIEKAKGILMKRRGLDEAAAFALLRRMAMDRQQRIGEFARLLLSAADIL